jgi:hypothetical protein
MKKQSVFYQNLKNLDHPVKPDDDKVWDCRASTRLAMTRSVSDAPVPLGAISTNCTGLLPKGQVRCARNDQAETMKNEAIHDGIAWVYSALGGNRTTLSSSGLTG